MDLQDTPAFMSSSPIMKLNHDILWKIFIFNSHPITYPLERNACNLLGIRPHGEASPEPALITIRRSSQVCSKWREVLLGQHRSFIWANTLDMRYLDQKGAQWREEVVRRTGNAPLTVIGHVGQGQTLSGIRPESFFAEDFFLKLLDVHWERIHLLVIFSTSHEVDKKLHVMLNRPAPSLRHFIVLFHNTVMHNYRKIPVTPFQNHAPFLSSFNVGALQIDFSSMSWAKELRYLMLVRTQIQIPMSEFLRKLEKAQALARLDIDFRTSVYGRTDEILTDLPLINLPHLKHLALPCAHPDVLSHISVSPQCTIAMECGFLSEEESHRFSDFVQTHFSTWNINHLSYAVKFSTELDGDYHQFHRIVMKDGDATKTVPHFDFCGFSWEIPIALDMAQALSSSACQPSLHRITSFELYLDPEALPNYVSLDDMTTLLRNLRSVETLHTDDKTLRLVHAETSPEPHLTLDGCASWFPDLRTVVVDKWDLGIETFLRLRLHDHQDMLVGERTRILVLLEDGSESSVRVGDPVVLEKASRCGVSVGWKGVGSESTCGF